MEEMDQFVTDLRGWGGQLPGDVSADYFRRSARRLARLVQEASGPARHELVSSRMLEELDRHVAYATNTDQVAIRISYSSSERCTMREQYTISHEIGDYLSSKFEVRDSYYWQDETLEDRLKVTLLFWSETPDL